MNTKHRINTKHDFDEKFLKVMNRTGFGKTVRNVRNHKGIKHKKTKKEGII